MTRVVLLALLALSLMSYTDLWAQPLVQPADSAKDSGKSAAPSDKPASEKANSLAPLLEKSLWPEKKVVIKFDGGQVAMPLVKDVPTWKVRDHLIKFVEKWPESAIDVGGEGVLLTLTGAKALHGTQTLVFTLFSGPGERPEVANIPLNDRLARNPKATLKIIGRDFSSIEHELQQAKDQLGIAVGKHTINVSYNHDESRGPLAKAIASLVKETPAIELFEHDSLFLIQPPLGSLGKTMQAVVGTLAENVPPPATESAKHSTDTVEQPASATDSPFPLGGLGGGGFGGFQSPLPAQAIPSKKYTSTSHIIIAIAEKGDRAWGYSKSLGKWATLKFDRPRPRDLPIVNEQVGCIQPYVTKEDLGDPRIIWAYSGITGTWDKVELPATAKAVVPVVNADTIIVEHDSLLQIFSAQTGKWSAPPKPEDETGSTVVEKQADTDPKVNVANVPSLKVFELAHMSAEATATVMQQLFRGDGIRVSADKRTNSLIVQAPDKDQALIEALLVRLDVEVPKAKREDAGASPTQLAANSEKLKRDYETADRKATKLAERFAKATSVSEEQQTELRQAVTHAFDLRQQLHRVELVTFRDRMMKVEQTIQTRDQFKNEIIERRVKDLLHPNLDWDATGSNQSKTTTPPTGASNESAQVKITVPGDTKAQFLHRVGERQGDFEVWQDLSDRLHVDYGKTARLSLSQQRDGRIVKWNASIQAAEPTGETQAYLKHNSVPIVITNEDLDLSPINSMPVVKVVYLPHPKTQELAANGTETMVSTRVDPNVDVVREAAKRGSVLVTVRLTGNEPEPALWPSGRPPTRRNDGRSIERPAAMSLGEAVAKFNEWLKAHPTEGGRLAPLSEEEVVASIRWAGTKEKPRQFENTEFEALLDIAESKHLPAGWQFTVGWGGREPVTRIPTRASLAYDVWRQRAPRPRSSDGQSGRRRETGTQGRSIVLTYVAADGWHPTHLVRVQETDLLSPDGKPVDAPAADQKDGATTGQTLADAVKEFNEYVKVDGQTESPLTEQEVAAAVFDWKVRRHDAPVSDEEFAKFQQIVEQRRLPAGFKLAVQRRSESRGSFIFDIWCVVILQNRSGLPSAEAIYSYVIRDRFISSRRATDDSSTQKQTAASKPASQPTSASESENMALLFSQSGLGLEQVAAKDFPATNGKFKGGLRVRRVREGSPAGAAAIKVDDILVGLDKWSTETLENAAYAIRETLSQSKANDVTTLSFVVLRGETTFTGKMLFSAVPAREAVRPVEGRDAASENKIASHAGATDELHVFQERAEKLAEEIKAYREQIKQANAQPDAAAAKALSERAQQRLDEQLQKLKRVRDQYDAQVRVFELKVKTDEKSKELAEIELLKAKKANSVLAGTIQASEIQRLQLKVEKAALEQQQSTTLLELFRKFALPEEFQSRISNADAERETVLNMYAIHRALRGYYDQFEHFPPAVVLGKDGKGSVPHSWRVEILPQLGYWDLYESYHFDEPWDSEHNKTLLTKMPAEFRSPLDRPDSTNASYFGMVTPGPQPALVPSGAPAAAAAGAATASPLFNSGAGTFFSNPAGIKVRDVSDGTANTIAFFEAKLPIPWTKPEDVSALIDNPLSKLGGWFPEGWHAGFVYGEVKYIAKDNPEASTRALFTIGGGEPTSPKLVEPADKQK